MNEFEPWALEAFKLRNEDGLTYEEIVPLFRNRFPGFSDLKIYEKIRRQIARISRSATAPAQTDETVNTNETPDAEPTTHNNTETITKQWVKDHVGKGIAPSTQPYEGETIARFISELKTEGYCIDGSAEDGYKLSKAIKANEPKKIDIPWDGCEVIRFGLVSDTHINSKYTQLTYLHNFYDICAENGIDTVYHAGDIDDGEEMRMGHKYECYTQGADDHIAEIVRVYPRRKGIKTLFITGNHDASIIKRCGYDIGYGIAKEREDMQYLGQSIADVMLTPNCKFRLQHPWDGCCFDDQTKIFTQNGWKLFKDLSKEDFVATMTKDTNEFQWQHPSEIMAYDYCGDLIHFSARTIDMLVTPNHGMWAKINEQQLGRPKIYKNRDKSKPIVDTSWKRYEAQEIYDQYRRQRFMFTNHSKEWNGIDIEGGYVEVPYVESKNIGMISRMKHIGKLKVEDAVELLCWYVTEGSVGTKYICITQDEKAHPENYAQILELCQRINISPNISGRNSKDITLGSKELAMWVESQCGKGSKNKRLPRWLLDLPTKYLEIAFDTLIKGDGCHNNKALAYSSISETLLDGVEEIAFKLGYACSRNNHVLSICNIQTTPTINKKPTKIPYCGKVYCCSVPNGLILVRRGRSATWSHNSYALSYRPQKMIESISSSDKPNLIAIGNYHKCEYLFYRNVHAFQAGCFQAETPFMKNKAISAYMGAWIIELQVEKSTGFVKAIKPQFIPYYKPIKEDYKNWATFHP